MTSQYLRPYPQVLNCANMSRKPLTSWKGQNIEKIHFFLRSSRIRRNTPYSHSPWDLYLEWSFPLNIWTCHRRQYVLTMCWSTQRGVCVGFGIIAGSVWSSPIRCCHPLSAISLGLSGKALLTSGHFVKSDKNLMSIKGCWAIINSLKHFVALVTSIPILWTQKHQLWVHVYTSSIITSWPISKVWHHLSSIITSSPCMLVGLTPRSEYIIPGP